MKIKIISIIVLFISFSNFSWTLEPVLEHDSLTENTTIVFDEKVLKKNYFVGIFGMVASNLVLTNWNKYVLGSGWAQVSLDKVWPPWERELELDTGWYWTNFVLHPYQGSLYYLSARNSNLNVAESFLITCAGSAMWEFFGELNKPSINDLVYSSLGGFIVGEMLYRFGLEASAKSDLLVFLFNPMRIITDPLTGHKPNGPVGNIYNLSFKGGLSTGVTGTWFERGFDFSKEIFPASCLIEADVTYSDPYIHDSNIPYSQFEFQMGGAIGHPSGFGKNESEKKLMYDIHIFSNGMMFSRSVNMGETKDTSIGLVVDYDFMWHSFAEFSSIAPGFAIKQRINEEKYILEWQSHLGVILLGTSDCYYFRRALMKPTEKGIPQDYSYTTGGTTVNKIRWVYGNNIVNVDFHGFVMYRIPYKKQPNGEAGWDLLGLLDLSYEYSVSENISLGISNELYMKKAFYKEKPDFFSILNTPSVYVKYSW